MVTLRIESMLYGNAARSERDARAWLAQKDASLGGGASAS